MNTIRPLATIAILAGLGYLLATQLHQNPVGEADELTANWGEAPPYEGGEATSKAPPFTPPDPPAFGTPPATDAHQASPTVDTVSTPPVAGMPELPPLAASDADSTTSRQQGLPALPAGGGQGVGPTDIPLPENIATADYSGAAASEKSPAAPMAQGSGSSPEAAPAPEYEDPYAQYDPAASRVTPADASGMPPLGAAPMDNQEAAIAGGDAYQPPAAPSYEATMPPHYAAAGASQGSQEGRSYEAALPIIQSALDNQELRRAHGLLSEWYADPSLTPVEREQVDRLLSQLAGTVVYSTEHLMEPPYVVKAGDTMETIAEQYNVPWRLLAKINGVPRAGAVQAGQVLKVVRGPFAAIVDLSESELALMVDGKYAGRFDAQLSGAADAEGAWRVDQKKLAEPAPTRYGPSQSPGKQIVLKNAAGVTLVLDATPAPGADAAGGRVSVAQADMEELSDILSVGSEVTIRR